MRLKPSGLRYLDIAKFQRGLRFYSVRCLYTGISVRFCGFVMLFCTVFGVYIPVFLSGFAMFVPSLPPPPLFRLLSDLKFYYMHVKVSILKPILVF